MRPVRIDDCPACGREGHQPIVSAGPAERQRFIRLSRRKYGGLMDSWLDELELVIVTCPACGHHWYRDQPDAEALFAMYAKGRPLRPALAEPPNRAPYEAHMLAEMKRLRSLVADRCATAVPRLLDYGAGFGRWSSAARAAGFDVLGYEPSQERSAHTSHSIPVVWRLGDLAGRRFDAINLEQVLEHVPDPLSVLQEMAVFCEAHAVLRITVPNMERPVEGRAIWQEWPFSGERMHTMAPFEHLHGFTPRSLHALVGRAKLTALSAGQLGRRYFSLALRRAAGCVLPALLPTKLLVVRG